jgi:hypothetical protein
MPQPPRAPRTKRPLTVAFAALALVAMLAACSNDGGSDGSDAATSTTANPTTTTDATTATTSVPELSAADSAEFEIASKFAQCMRENGVDGFPDPHVDETGFMLVGVPWERDAQKWGEAQRACQHILDDAAPPNDAAPPDETGAAAGWERVVPGGDCQCSDGSEFSFWMREANPEKVILFLQGGGNCFSAETCAPGRDIYDRTIDHEDDPNGEGGIFDFADQRNPFADFSVVYVPYCTADVHIGNTTTDYGPDLTVHHKGYVNGAAALDHLAATFPRATEVVVMGESAGSVPAPLYAGLVSDRLPDARITVLADGSGAAPNSPDLNRRLFDAWGADNTMPAWPENAGVAAEQWSAQQLVIQSGRHDPDIVFARHDYAYDERQTVGAALVFDSPVQDLLSLIDANETQIEAAGVNLLSYIAPGEAHTVLTDDPFYTESVNGERLVDWVTRLIAGEPVDDLHCTECTG